MEQHPVPQHIAAFQFKLFGNLTARQFITLAIPMSVAIAIYFSNLPNIIRLPLAGLIGLLGVVLALVPINGRPIDQWVVIFIKAIMTPTQRIWVKEQKIPEFLSIVVKAPPVKKKIPEEVTLEAKQRLLEYLRSLPTETLTPLDTREQMALARLNLGPVGEVGEGKLPPAIAWPKLPVGPAPQEVVAGLAEALPPSEVVPEAAAPVVIAPHAMPYVLPGLEKKLEAKPGTRKAIELLTFIDREKRLETEIRAPRRLASEINYSSEMVIPLLTPDRKIRLVPGIGKTRVRKLHFAPPVNFDLSRLPVRGERRFEISEELKKRYHLEEATSAPPVILPIETKIGPVVSPVNAGQDKGRPKTVLSVDLMARQQVTPAVGVALKQPAEETLDTKMAARGKKLDRLAAAGLGQAQMVPLTNKPNVLSGQITDVSGAPIAGAIFVVRDANGIPVRALKTNKLGQFLSATSLANGRYVVEVEAAGVQFDSFAITLGGQVVAPLLVRAKEKVDGSN